MTFFNDPIADLLTRIRNAISAQHKYVDVGLSNMKLSIIKILKDQGFVENFLVSEERKKIRIFLKYTTGRETIIKGIKRISTPGLRRYVNYKKIPKIYGGIGIAILSTSKGVLEGEEARKNKLGGEMLCQIW